MTFDSHRIADRLKALLPPGSPAEPLIDQLYGELTDQEYLALAIAIARTIAATGAR